MNIQEYKKRKNIGAYIVLVSVIILAGYLYMYYQALLTDHGILTSKIQSICFWVIIAFVFIYGIIKFLRNYYVVKELTMRCCNTYYYVMLTFYGECKSEDNVEKILNEFKTIKQEYCEFFNINIDSLDARLVDDIEKAVNKFQKTDIFKYLLENYPYCMHFLADNRELMHIKNECRKKVSPNYSRISFVYNKLFRNSENKRITYKLLKDALVANETKYRDFINKLIELHKTKPFGVEKYIMDNTDKLGFILIKDKYEETITVNEAKKDSIISEWYNNDTCLEDKVIEEEKERKRKAEEERAKRDILDTKLIPLQNKYEDDLKKWKDNLYNESIKEIGRLTKRTINGIPHEFLFYYYPANRTVSPMHSKVTSKIVIDFKMGRVRDDVMKSIVDVIGNYIDSLYEFFKLSAPKKPQADYSMNKIEYITKCPYSMEKIRENMAFVCIPSSNESDYKLRCMDFSRKLCEQLGIANGFEPKENVFSIEVGNSLVPKHMGGDGTNEKLYVDTTYFKGKHLILFDDIVTSGDTMRKWIARFQEWGATVDFIISLGYTYRDEFGDVEDPVKFE